ncbi:MAG: WG repeat-containing protein [Treponema sp.]|nr:WG repeat-containing protein [Treponema sp.]
MSKRILDCLIFMVLLSLVSCSDRKQEQGHIGEDSTEKEVIPFYYNTKYGLIDSNRNVIVNPVEAIHLMSMVDGAAVVVTKEFHRKVIDCNGNVIAEHFWDCGRNFSEGLLPIKFRDRSGFINNRGDFVFECPISLDYYGYEQSPKGYPNLECSFSEGLAYVPASATEWNIYDKEGTCLAEGLQFIPKMHSVFRKGLLCVYDKDGTRNYGYIDKYGKLIIPFMFTQAEDFSSGYAMVVYNGKDALVDTEGNVFYSEDIIAGNKAPAFFRQ